VTRPRCQVHWEKAVLIATHGTQRCLRQQQLTNSCVTLFSCQVQWQAGLEAYALRCQRVRHQQQLDDAGVTPKRRRTQQACADRSCADRSRNVVGEALATHPEPTAMFKPTKQHIVPADGRLTLHGSVSCGSR
jgi:hypothetical protein